MRSVFIRSPPDACIILILRHSRRSFALFDALAVVFILEHATARRARVASSRPSTSMDDFDAIYAELMDDRATSGRPTSTSSASAGKDLSSLVRDVRVFRPRSSSARERTLEIEEEESEDDALARATTPMGSKRCERDVESSKSPRMDYSSRDVLRGETPESLLRYLRDEQRMRGEVERKVNALELEMADRDEEARAALEDARVETEEWRERCKQLRRDVPERWLGVFESYDAEIDRLGRENFSLREDAHRMLAEAMEKDAKARERASSGVDAASGDGEDEFIHLRRALRAATLERDAMAVKLADVDRRERQMSLVRRHSEGVSKRLARVERLLLSEQARVASATARAARADAATASLITEYESQLTSARALIEDLALRCDASDLRAAADAHDRKFPPKSPFPAPAPRRRS